MPKHPTTPEINDAMRRLLEMNGGGWIPSSKSRVTAREYLARVVKAEDDTLFDALLQHADNTGDHFLIPRTPAWVKDSVTGLWPKWSGQLVLIYDRLVFFESNIVLHPRQRFVVPVPDATIKWRGRARDDYGFDLTYDGHKHHLTFFPPKGYSVRKVSGSAEGPGLTDFGTMLTSSGAWAVFDVAADAFAFRRHLKISKIHRAMWKDSLARLGRGERPPFSLPART